MRQERAPLRLVVWPKRLLHLALAGGLLALGRSFALPWSLTLALTIVPLVALETLLRGAVGRRTRRFEKELMARLQTGKEDELLPLYRGQLLLRFAAPRHLTLGKLGLILARLGRHREAVAAYREALTDAGPERGYSLALGLAGSLYELGQDQEAEKVYRSVVDEERINVQACARLSRLILKRGGEPGEAERYMRMAVEAARGGALRCELVEQLAEQQRLDEARQELSHAEKELAASDDPRARAALDRARARLDL